jgi:hypothetical protein
LTAVLGVAASAGASTAHVENRCPRLSEAGYEELDARVQLLLRSEGTGRPLPAVVCTDEGSWVEWEERRYPILGRGSIEDEVVDILEAELHDAERKADADPRSTEEAAVAAGQPMLERGAGTAPAPPARVSPADPVAMRASDARGGGIALGVEVEAPSETIAFAIGPTFDFATSVGPLMIGGREAFRVASGERRVLFMDFQAAVGYGAPLNPDKLFGVVGRFGAEWMVAYPEGNSGQAAVAPVFDVGLRLSKNLRWVGIWGGPDLHMRLSRLTLRSSSTLTANELGVSLTLGVAFVDWSRK